MRKPIAAPAYDYDSDKKELNVSWTAPADDDATAVTYATGAINDQFKPFVPGSNELYAGVEFPANLYKSAASPSFLPPMPTSVIRCFRTARSWRKAKLTAIFYTNGTR